MKRPSAKESERKILTVADVADFLRVHPQTVYRLLKTRQLPAFRIGSDWRFSRDDVESWMQGHSDSES